MQTRVPAWCDRVLLNPIAKMLVQDVRDTVNLIISFLNKYIFIRIIFYIIIFFQISSPDAVEYGIIGPTTCMGDHKVSQSFNIKGKTLVHFILIMLG